MALHVRTAVNSSPAPRRGRCTEHHSAQSQDLVVQLALIEVSDLRLQMGKVPFKWSKFNGLEIDEPWPCVNDEDIESVRRTMDHPLAACRLRQPSNSVDQCLVQESAVNVRKFGRKIWAL
jgi:hypothetical protein